MHELAKYFPIVTTVFSFIIAWEMFVHYRNQRSIYLLCWTIGICSFGLASLAASINALAGWSAANLKFWYITGALVVGIPLAQGTLYFLKSRKFADVSTVFFIIVTVVGAVAVALSPVVIPPGFDYELSGKVFGWKWVRAFSAIINSYSFLVLVGGAIFSAYRYYAHAVKDESQLGNATIALGGILPGIGGILMRMGHVDALFVTDFLALVVIYSGYRLVKHSM